MCRGWEKPDPHGPGCRRPIIGSAGPKDAFWGPTMEGSDETRDRLLLEAGGVGQEVCGKRWPAGWLR